MSCRKERGQALFEFYQQVSVVEFAQGDSLVDKHIRKQDAYKVTFITSIQTHFTGCDNGLRKRLLRFGQFLVQLGPRKKNIIKIADMITCVPVGVSGDSLLFLSEA